MSVYIRKSLSELPFDVGTAEHDGSRSSDGREGALSYGPYSHLPVGAYFAGFRMKLLMPSSNPDAASIHLTSGRGTRQVGLRSIPASEMLAEVAGLIGIKFVLHDDAELFEAVLRVHTGISVNVTELLVFSVDR